MARQQAAPELPPTYNRVVESCRDEASNGYRDYWRKLRRHVESRYLDGVSAAADRGNVLRVLRRSQSQSAIAFGTGTAEATRPPPASSCAILSCSAFVRRHAATD